MDVRGNFEMRQVTGGENPEVALSGELDVASADEVWAVIEPYLSQGAESLVIDMSGVTFVDSRGLSVLIRAWNALSPGGGTVVLRGAQPRIVRVLEVAGVDGVFTLV